MLEVSRHSLSDVLLNRRLPSILLERGDCKLVAFDRDIRKQLVRSIRNMSRVTSQIVDSHVQDARPLALIYRSIIETYEFDWHVALIELREAEKTAPSLQIKARALQFLVQILYTNSVSLRGSGDLGKADELESECRTLCERGLVEFESAPWRKSITYTLHSALGVLDYYANQPMGAKVHLRRALEEFVAGASSYDKKITINMGFVELCLGHLAREDGDVASACNWYERAIKNLGEEGFVSVAPHLASAILSSGRDFRRARRIVKRARGKLGKGPRAEMRMEKLALLSAQADYLLGRGRVAERELIELVGHAKDPDVVKEAEKWLRNMGKSANIESAKLK